MAESPQARYTKRVNAKWPRIQVQLLASDGALVNKWLALLAKHGGQKPAIIALLKGAKGE